MEIISERKYVTNVTYGLSFYDKDDVRHSKGFLSFECDKDGNVDTSKMHECALENYNKCLANEDGQYADPIVERYEHNYTEHASGKCDCGELVYLANFTNTCACGADYNSSGQRLANREQWGEETGEHWTECV